MSDYTKPLDNSGWAEHYNLGSLNNVKNYVSTGNVQVWAKELCKIIKEGESCLEIGCGSGISSLWLAKNRRKATALDYTESSVALVSRAAKEMNIDLNVVLADATKKLPFENRQFDYVFQSGLLEHFSSDEQVTLLKNWGGVCKYMISMIPNASSVPYRVGKQIMENNGTWEYGLETPRHSLANEFVAAGAKNVREYTIGTEWALRFLPKRHYVRKYYEKLIKEGYNLDDMMQGYLLVTIGCC